MSEPYMKALHKVLTDDSPLPVTSLSRADIESAITDISNQLKGPLSDVERLWLVEDRQILRKQLAARKE